MRAYLPRKSLDRFPIDARLGVPEIWADDSGSLRVFILQEGVDHRSDHSLARPQVPMHELMDLIETHRSAGWRSLRRAIRDWVQSWSTSGKGTVRTVSIKTQNPRPRTKNPEPKTQNPRPRTQDPEPKTQNPRPKTENPKSRNLEI